MTSYARWRSVLFAAEEPLTAEQISAHLAGAGVRDCLAGTSRSLLGPWHPSSSSAASAGNSRPRPILRICCGAKRSRCVRLSRAATEVLAIIAYHEPVSRAEIEAIRGVQTARGTLDVLMEAGWGPHRWAARSARQAGDLRHHARFSFPFRACQPARTARLSTNSRQPACSTRWMMPYDALTSASPDDETEDSADDGMDDNRDDRTPPPPRSALEKPTQRS